MLEIMQLGKSGVLDIGIELQTFVSGSAMNNFTSSEFITGFKDGHLWSLGGMGKGSSSSPTNNPTVFKLNVETGEIITSGTNPLAVSSVYHAAHVYNDEFIFINNKHICAYDPAADVARTIVPYTNYARVLTTYVLGDRFYIFGSAEVVYLDLLTSEIVPVEGNIASLLTSIRIGGVTDLDGFIYLYTAEVPGYQRGFIKYDPVADIAEIFQEGVKRTSLSVMNNFLTAIDDHIFSYDVYDGSGTSQSSPAVRRKAALFNPKAKTITYSRTMVETVALRTFVNRRVYKITERLLLVIESSRGELPSVSKVLISKL